MRKKRFSGLAILVTVIATGIVAFGLGGSAVCAYIGRDGLAMAQAVVMVNEKFVGEHDLKTATDAALGALVDGLGDRWSYYLSAEEYEQQNLHRANAYVGIGVTIEYESAGLRIISVVPEGPSALAGLVVGDLILEIEDTKLTPDNQREAVADLQGEAGTAVNVLLRPAAGGADKIVAITRAVVQEHPAQGQLLPDKTGLVTIANFNDHCAEEAKAAVEELLAQGATRLVFDVRDNGGGYLHELNALQDYLLPEGVVFRGQNKAGHEEVYTSDAACIDLPMATVVNANSYSAAELFAAELQEKIGAPIVGEKTSGKGFSQQSLPLISGGAMNISTAKYFTGGGVSLIGTGLTLDDEVGLTEAEQSARLAGKLSPEQDPQIQAAIAAMEE